MSDLVAGALLTLVGSIVTFVGSYILTRNAKEQEKNKDYIKKCLEEIKSFYNLEQLYMASVAELRTKLIEAGGELPDNAKSTTPLGVQREFRSQNEENNNIITMTAKEAEKRLAYMD